MPKVIPVILSGGSGTRLWPLSRKQYPKQLISLVNETTMLQDTLLRTDGFDASDPLIICNEDHRFLVAEQILQLNKKAASIVLEPCGRNTAPAIAVAALMQEDPDSILLVLSADHVIMDVDQFQTILREGVIQAELDMMVVFGVVPNGPETCYGYIQAGELLGETSRRVDSFVEKPDLATAEKYLAEGNYFWNGGMFMFKAGRFIDELKTHHPEMLKYCQLALDKSETDLDFTRLDKDAFEKCPSDSIDYAVMEHTKKAVVIPMDVGWSDVGSWSSLWDVSEKDSEGNRFVGDVLSTDSSNNYVYSRNRLVALVGMEDTVVVDTQDAILIASKDKVQEVKDIVSQLNKLNRSETENHRQVYRPWGYYDSIDVDEGFQVKRITVNPGATLSLQKHHHRAEHWIVVSGTAEVTCGDKVFMVSKNESTYIPIGEKHRLSNPGKIPLKLIEVQSGDYLGEDDIVRFDDVYGRS
ncbi:MAG: mannose-1-phosphate guanylyltransferase/mannose-6-phosphate isomerase [Pseudomonadales bacterium]|nr:mannose-1-phosphate guanylyltransferase/mannose-6-phosphate isomerase [Pseudomonadales bacterium]